MIYFQNYLEPSSLSIFVENVLGWFFNCGKSGKIYEDQTNISLNNAQLSFFDWDKFG